MVSTGIALPDTGSGPHLRLAELRIPGTSGTGQISAALADKPEVRANMHVRARMLSRSQRPWDRKFYRVIKGAKGLFEMKWMAEGRQWRVSGFDYEGYFVMLLLYSHKQNTYSPPNWRDTSKRNYTDVNNGKYDIVTYSF